MPNTKLVMPKHVPKLTLDQCKLQIKLAANCKTREEIFAKWHKAGLTRGFKALPNQFYIVRMLRSAEGRIKPKPKSKTKKAV